MIRTSYYVSIHKTLSDAIPADLEAVMDTTASTITGTINSTEVIGDADYFPAQFYVGIYNQNSSSAGVLERILCYDFKA